jgi:hypothetical protein
MDRAKAIELIRQRFDCGEGRAEELLRAACRDGVRHRVDNLRGCAGPVRFRTGPIIEVDDDDFADWLNEHAPQKHSGKPNRTKPARENAIAALTKLYPAGVPTQAALGNDKLVDAVLKELRAQKRPPVSNTTILRAAGRRQDRRGRRAAPPSGGGCRGN